MDKKLPILILLLIVPSVALGIPGTEQVIQDNSALLLWASFGTITALLAIGKIAWDWVNKKIEDKSSKIETQEEKTYKAELDLRDQKISQLQERVSVFEKEHRECNRNLPLIYVTKTEYDKHMDRFENMMKEFKNELREDMSNQIERIVKLISEMTNK